MKVSIPEELKLETETCSRCGGCGNYSYCQMYGTTCFKCAGAGKVLTKRGKAAMNYLRQLRSKPASKVKPGDWIRTHAGSKSYKVLDVAPVVNTSRSWINGVEQPQRQDLLNINTVGVLYSHVAPETSVACLWDAETTLEQHKAAKAYEQSLTKQGKPRKQLTKNVQKV